MKIFEYTDGDNARFSVLLNEIARIILYKKDFSVEILLKNKTVTKVQFKNYDDAFALHNNLMNAWLLERS